LTAAHDEDLTLLAEALSAPSLPNVVNPVALRISEGGRTLSSGGRQLSPPSVQAVWQQRFPKLRFIFREAGPGRKDPQVWVRQAQGPGGWTFPMIRPDGLVAPHLSLPWLDEDRLALPAAEARPHVEEAMAIRRAARGFTD